MRMPTFKNIAAAMCVLSAAVAAHAQDADRGRALYDANGCYQCHGHAGQGGAAARIAPSPYPLEAFAQLVRRPANEMPAYAAAVLSDTDLEAIYRYVRSVPEPPAIADIPALR
jgi:mono/diheme cytochrome c family protein